MVDFNDSIEIDVDGERWSIKSFGSGRYQFDWLSHPEGYGFTVTNSAEEQMTENQMVESIRDFVRHVNPATGYPDD